jgi:hypothetical protein
MSTIFITAGEKNEDNTHTSDSKNIATLLLIRSIQSAWMKEEEAQQREKTAQKKKTASQRHRGGVIGQLDSALNPKKRRNSLQIGFAQSTSSADKTSSGVLAPLVTTGSTSDELSAGDRVRVVKKGQQLGETGVVKDPNWAGRVKIVMDEGGLVKSYMRKELALAAKLGPGSFDIGAIPDHQIAIKPVHVASTKRTLSSLSSANLFNRKRNGRHFVSDLIQEVSSNNTSAHTFGADMNLCITEILDTRTQRMISSNPLLVASADYLQTNEMASRVLAQVVVRKELKNVFDELLGAAGNSIYLRPATNYLHPNEYSNTCPYTEQISFMGLAKRTFSRGEILMGIKQQDKKPMINPKEKLMIDKNIDWTVTELIVMLQPKDRVKKDVDSAAKMTARFKTEDNDDVAAKFAREMMGEQSPKLAIESSARDDAIMAALEEQRKEQQKERVQSQVQVAELRASVDQLTSQLQQLLAKQPASSSSESGMAESTASPEELV